MTAARTIERIAVEREGVTISRLIWDRFGAPSPATLAGIYDLNPGLASAGGPGGSPGGSPVLPVGTVVLVPVPDPGPAERAATITLWD